MMAPYGYSKLDKEDPDEMMHHRAQFLIYKTLKQVDSRKNSSLLRVRLRRLTVKTGKKLRKLRKTMFAARVGVCRQVTRQWKILFGHGHIMANLPRVKLPTIM